MYRLFNVLVVLICIHEISSDPQQQTDLQSKLSDRPSNPTGTFPTDTSSLRSHNEHANDNEMETFYQKISQQLRSLDEHPPSTESTGQRSSVQPKSAGETTNKGGKKFSCLPSVRSPLPAKTKDSKTNNQRHHFRPISWPATRDLPRIGSPTSEDGRHQHLRTQRDTSLGRRPPQKGRLRPKTDEGFHFRLVLRNGTRRSNSKLDKQKHPVNLHVLRKRAAILESAATKQKHTDEIYLESNEIVDEDSANDKMWSSELAKDKLNFYAKKFADATPGLEHEFQGNSGEARENGGVEEIFQNATHFGSTSSVENADQSNTEKCGNPQIFSYRYYWCRAKNVFRNFIKLFKTK